jgi:hypothetical protein
MSDVKKCDTCGTIYDRDTLPISLTETGSMDGQRGVLLNVGPVGHGRPMEVCSRACLVVRLLTTFVGSEARALYWRSVGLREGMGIAPIDDMWLDQDMIETLRFYASEENWQEHASGIQNSYGVSDNSFCEIWEDKGANARETLEKYKVRRDDQI